MKKALFLVAAGILLAASNPADAHQKYSMRGVGPRDFLASQQRTVTSDLTEGTAFRGPTSDPLGTATGGPVGGLPDRN